MKIVDFNSLNEVQRKQAAQMLTDELSHGWPTFTDAMDEINELYEILNDEPNALLLAAIDEDEVIGWAGLFPEYGKLFELHPLVVRGDKQRKGIGTILLNAITSAAKEKGGLTLILSSGDERPGGETSLANIDLYDDLPRQMAQFTPGTHSTAFYLKRGFKVIGVIPDVYGIGKPDIQMAKQL